jgi:hypothetical protein
MNELKENGQVVAHQIAVRQYKQRNREKHNMWNAQHYKRNKEELKRKRREWYTKSK